MKAYKEYPKYVASKLFWIDQLPEDWKVKKVTHSISYKVGFTPESGNPIYYGEGYPWVNISDLGPRVINTTAKQITDDAIEKYKKKPAKKGSVLYSFKLSVGQVSFAGRDIYTNEAIAAFEESKDLLLSYFYYLAPIAIIQNASENIYGAKILNQEAIGNAKLIIPPKEDQEKIADFLDYKSAQIDALIAKKETLLFKLQEKRSALITQAVTKGINPNAPMKPSCVEWLGDVPAHWDVKRLKFAVNLINEKIEAESSDLDYMGLEHIESWTGRRIQDENAFSDGIASNFSKGDVLFGKLRPYLAKVYLANHAGLVSTEALVLRAKKELYSGFLSYYMITRDFIKTVNSSTFGSKMPRASWDFIGNLPILLPEYEEQVLIANFIDSELIIIDAQKKKIEDVIAKLVEYRSALITNAVTGKIDVRDFAIPSKA